MTVCPNLLDWLKVHGHTWLGQKTFWVFCNSLNKLGFRLPTAAKTLAGSSGDDQSGRWPLRIEIQCSGTMKLFPDLMFFFHFFFWNLVFNFFWFSKNFFLQILFFKFFFFKILSNFFFIFSFPKYFFQNLFSSKKDSKFFPIFFQIFFSII